MLDKLRAYPMVILLLPLVVAILLFARWQPQETLPSDEQAYAFVITGAPKSTPKCERYEVDVANGEWQKTNSWTNTHVYLYLLRDSARAMPTYGDTVLAWTHIDWQRTTGRAFAARYTIRSAAKHKIPLQIRLYERLRAAGLNGDELATVGALTLGYKDDIDPEVRRHFQASGAAHVLAVSGLHTGIIYALLLGLLTLGGRFRPLYEHTFHRCVISLIVIAAMWFYAWLTGLTPSVVRAVVMVTIFEIGRMLYRQTISLNTIAAAAFIILTVRPSDLWSVSFQLSFAATAAIVIFAKECEKVLHRSEWRHIFRGRVASWIAGTIVVSIAAQLGTLPITMHTFGQVSNYFLLTNLIVLPLASVLVPCGLISMALGGSVVGVWFSKITWALAWLMNHSVGWIESLPGSTMRVQCDTMMVVLLYAAMLMGWLSLHPLNPKKPARALLWLVGVAAILVLFLQKNA